MANDDPNKGAQDKPEAGAKAPRRKPPTLDLSARDVTPPEDDKTAAAPAPDGASDVPSAVTPVPDDAATAATASDTPPPDDTPLDPAAPAAAPAGEPADEAPVPPAKRPPRQLGFFGVALAALVSGLLGGAVALAVVSTFYSAEDNIDAITELEARALDLRQRVETLEARGETPPAGEATAAAGGLAAPDQLAARLDALESGLDTLGRKVDTLPAPAAAPAGDGAPAAEVTALAGRVDALEQKAASAPAPAPAASPEDVAAVAGRLGALEQRVAAIPAPAPAASPADVEAAQARIAALEGKLNAMAESQRASGQGAAQLVALASLRDAVAAGRPFATELKAARVLLGEEAAPLAVLDPAANGGFGDGPALAARLKAATAPAPAAASPAPAAGTSTVEGVVERLWDSAQNLVVIRRASGTSGDPRVGEAEVALARGDYAGARTALAGVPEADRAAVQPVIAALDARQAALDAIAGLNQRVLATLAGGAQ